MLGTEGVPVCTGTTCVAHQGPVLGHRFCSASSRTLVGYCQVNTTVHGVGGGTMITSKFWDSPGAH